jgi:membrane associated rhomboid family serine protease
MYKDMWRNMPPVTKNLLIINTLIWAFMAIAPWTLSMRMDALFSLHYVTSPGFKIWQPFTYMFLHGGFTHLFFNMFALFMFGTTIEYVMGSRRFLSFYVVCGLGAAFIQEIVYALMLTKYNAMFTPVEYEYIVQNGWQAIQEGKNFMDPYMGGLNALVNGSTVGASGAIYGILLAFGMIFPNREMYIMFIPVPVKAKWVVLGYAVIELVMGISGANDNVAHFAHLGGMIFAFVMLIYWKKKGYFRGYY